jgi:hypothetical protein
VKGKGLSEPLMYMKIQALIIEVGFLLMMQARGQVADNKALAW